MPNNLHFCDVISWGIFLRSLSHMDRPLRSVLQIEQRLSVRSARVRSV